MKRLFALLFVAVSITACSDNDSDGNVAGPPPPNENPTENPTPAPTPIPTPFAWASVSFEDESTLAPEPPGCENQLRFTVSRDGTYSARESCSSERRSGRITDEQRVRLEDLMEEISASQARAKLSCRTLPEDIFMFWTRIRMTSSGGKNYVLYRHHVKTICELPNAAEIEQVRQYLYELRSLHVTTTPPQ